MREFNIRDERSRYQGKHNIYDSPEEFYEKVGKIDLKRWGEFDPATLERGEWIISDDGYVLQVLAVRAWKTSWFVRVAPVTRCVWKRKNGTFKWNQLHAQFTFPHKNSGAGIVNNINDDSTYTYVGKIKFATYIVMGCSIKDATRMAFPYTTGMARSSYSTRGVMLMSDEIVREEIKRQLIQFGSEIDSKFSNDKLLSELEQLLHHSKKGSDAHRNNIQFIMSLRGMYGTTQKKSKVESAEEAMVVEDEFPEANL